MRKKLFNIHKLIGINVILFFFLSLFFGTLTILQPYINIWEDSKKHISFTKIEDIQLDKCIKQVSKRTYFDENGKKIPKNFVKLRLPVKELSSSNLIKVQNRPNFHLDPKTCKRVRPKNFTISRFFDKIHTGGIFNSLLIKIIFGFMSVAVVFLSISGLFMIIKTRYKNNQTKTLKGFLAKNHRLLLTYTLPLVFMFGLTGALFNLGVYSSPLITSYLTNGQTANVLKVQRNILQDPDLEVKEASVKVKSISLNKLYEKAQKELSDVKFYDIQVYNHNDINSKVKFIGYEPINFFISSITNESYIVLDGINATVLDKKLAKEGSFAEKTLDAIFYLHYLRTFSDIPRIAFFFICLFILAGLTYAMLLWLKRTSEDKFSHKVLKPLSFTIMLGSVLSASALFATSWIIPKAYMHFTFLEKFFNTQEVIFYFVFLLLFIYVLIKKDLAHILKQVLTLSAFLLIIALIAHQVLSGVNFFNFISKDIYIPIYSDCALLLFAGLFLFATRKINFKQKS